MGLILVCFFFSGMTGLIYEILWTRMIVKIIGGAPFAVSIILTVFMGGLGLGSFIAGRMIDKIKEPMKLVRLYGVLELAIGVYCLMLSPILIAFRPVYAILYNRLFEHFMLYNLLTFIGCGLLLLIPVICMGATLPILCRFYVSRLSHLGDHIGRLYGLNTIGAAFGALVCGFWLINYLGMAGTTALAVAANGIIGAVAIVASYKMKFDSGFEKAEHAEEKKQKQDGELIYKGAVVAALVIFAVSGFCSMAYEVIWTKLLALIIGPTTYSFTIVLVTFITGLALGSMLFGWLGDKVRRPIWLLLYTQLAAGLLALLVSQLLGNSQFFFAKLIHQFQDNFLLLNISKAVILFCFILLPTLCLGATFPLVGKIYTRSLSNVGKSIGSVYAINTIGAVLGSFCAGFLIVPLIGKENGLRLVFSIQIATALIISIRLLVLNNHRKLQWAPIMVPAVAGLVLCFYFPSWNRAALVWGRYHPTEIITSEFQKIGWVESLWKGPEILGKQRGGEIVYYGDGIGGFTAVLRNEDAFGNIDFALMVTGKGESSSCKDMPTQTLSTHFPMMFHHNPKSVLVIGLGGGMTAGEMLCYPIDRLDVVEISGEVANASGYFNPWNGNVLANPKTNLIVQDGRAHLQLTNRSYDVIVSEPSNPWMAGVANLFTREVFALAKDRLNDGGVFAQFIHSYQMDWPTFSLVCRTFADVFDNGILVNTENGYYILVAFKDGRTLDFANAKRNFEFAKTSKNAKLLNPEIMYRLVMSEDLNWLFGQGPINTDNRPYLEYSAPKNMFIDDAPIEKNIIAKKRFTPQTAKIYQKVTADIDSQIDFAVLLLSLHSQFPRMVNLSAATAEQKERYYKVVEDYCANRKLDYSMLTDEKLKQSCRVRQIEAIKTKLPIIKDKMEAYYMLGNLYRESRLFAEAEKYYKMVLPLAPDHATLHNNLAVALHYQSKFKEALEHYDEAIRLRTDYPEAESNRQKALRQLGR